jgi:hypothetical protein
MDCGVPEYVSCLLLGVDGIGLFLVCIGLDLDSAHVELDLGVTTKLLVDWPHFMGICIYPSKQGPLSHLLLSGNWGTNKGAKYGRAMVGLALGRRLCSNSS